MTQHEVMNVQEVAELLDFHPEYVRQMARQGRIPGVKVGRKWRFVREQIIDWLKAGAPPQPRRPLDQE